MKPLRHMIVAGLLLVGGACTGVSPEQRQMLDRGLEQYQAKKYAQAETDLSRFISAVKTGPDLADAYYVRGLARVQLGKTAAAARDFESALNYSPPALLAARLHVAQGNLDTAEDRPREAITHYAGALHYLEVGPPTDQVLYWMGVNQQILGQWLEAGLSFSRLLEEYHTSPLAEPARERLRYQAYTIRLGLYRDMEAAKHRAEELRSSLPDVQAVGVVQAGLPMAAVQTGNYQTRAEARAALAAVRKTVPQASLVPGDG